MSLRPISFREACEFIKTLHRHHLPPQGYKFGIAAESEGKMVGVATVGRPVARKSDDGYTAEVTRLCTDGTANACSLLYGACARAAKAMGFRRILTYTLDSEGGASLRASGWELDGTTEGGTWDRPSRSRTDSAPTCRKKRWVRRLSGH